MAASYNLYVDQGSTYTVDLKQLNTDGTVRNLGDFTSARSQLRRSYYTTANTEFTANITDSSNGIVTLSLTDTQTSALKPGRYVYDVELVSSTNTVTRIVEGIVTVSPEVTK